MVAASAAVAGLRTLQVMPASAFPFLPAPTRTEHGGKIRIWTTPHGLVRVFEVLPGDLEDLPQGGWMIGHSLTPHGWAYPTEELALDAARHLWLHMQHSRP